MTSFTPSMLSSFERMKFFHMSGNDGEEATPVPIPNTEVKLFSADGSWDASPCESRTLPGNSRPVQNELVFFVLQKKIYYIRYFQGFKKGNMGRIEV